MPRPLAISGSVVIAVLVGLLMLMATDKRILAFTLGVPPGKVATVLKPDDEACQRPIDVSEDAASVRFQVGTFRRPGEPLKVTVTSASGGIPSATARLGPGYPDNSVQETRIGSLRAGNRVAVCIRNLGSSRVALYGSGPEAARTSGLSVNGKQRRADLTLLFQRDRPTSVLSLVPRIIDRAALFRPTWVHGWLFWLIAFALMLLVPILLSRALMSAPGARKRADGETDER